MKLFYGLPAALIGTAAIVLVQPQFANALISEQVNNIAKEVTVRIDGSSSASNGSGVIIERQENGNEIIYSVVTNWHVVEKQDRYAIRTSDDRIYVATQVQRLPGVDLAILRFASDKLYNIVGRGNSEQLTEGQRVYFAGYPAPIQVETRRSYRFITANITGRLSAAKDGYALVYDGPSIPGMSGGPVFDENGRLVAIHGETESVGSGLGTAGNYGIPINTFFALQPQATSVAIATTVAPSFAAPTQPDTLTTPPQPPSVLRLSSPPAQVQPREVTTSSEPPLTPVAPNPQPTPVVASIERSQPTPTIVPPTVVTPPPSVRVTPPPPTIVTFSPTSLPNYIVPTNPNQPLAVPNITKINDLLQREGLTPVACTTTPKVEIIGIQYTVCASPTANRPVGRYEVRTGAF